MRHSSAGHRKLLLLNRVLAGRPFASIHEQRRCILCDRVFRAREIRVDWRAADRSRLHCPTAGCESNPDLWVNPANPLLSEDAWRDWDRAIDELEHHEELATIPPDCCA